MKVINSREDWEFFFFVENNFRGKEEQIEWRAFKVGDLLLLPPGLLRTGVSNSNLVCEGHIQKKKCFAGHSLSVKSSCGPQFTRKALKIS